MQTAHTPSTRVRLLLLLGVVLIGGAWYVRSSPWMHEMVLRGKDLPELEAFVRDHPEDGAAQYYLGKRYMQRGRFAEARSAYDVAVRLDPNSARVRLELGYSLYAQGDLKLARTEFEQAKKRDGRLALAEYMLGKIAWSERNIQEAEPHLKRAAELDPQLDEAWYGMGLCLIQLRQLDAAVSAMRKAIAINPNRSEYPAALGELELTLSDNTEDARRQYERALQLNPNYGQACALMGEFLAHHYNGNEKDSLDRAETLLLKATVLPTYRPQDVYRELGQIYNRRAQYRKAVPMLQESIRLDPNDERAYFALIKAYQGLGDARAAEATQARFKFISKSQVEKYSLESHLSLQPTDAAARLKLARICLEFGLVAQAAYQYKLYLDLRPDAHDASIEQRLREQTAADAARLHLKLGLSSLMP